MEGASQMPKRSSQYLERVSVVETEYRYKQMVSMIDAKIKVTGMYSGQEYVFDGAGSVVDVDERDVEWMLGKRQGERQCCGGSGNGNAVFALKEE
jgi:hypothetical protein